MNKTETKRGAFSITALAWHRAGLGAVLPTVAGGKNPCVGGEYDDLHWWGRERPGYHVETVTEEQIRAWDEQWPDAGVCCSPRGAYVVLDVDQYDAKAGLFNLADLLYPDEAPETARKRLQSALQGTVRVTARKEAESGQRWLRLTEEQQARIEAEGLRLKRNPCPDVEILDYRYEGILPGTRHPKVKRLYRADLGGQPIRFEGDVEAGVAEFVAGVMECPDEWFEALTEPARYGAGASSDDTNEWVRENCPNPDGEPGSLLRRILDAYEQRKEPYVGANHEIAKRVQLDLLNTGAYDCQPGLLTAVAGAETITNAVHGGLRRADDWDSLWEGLSDGRLPDLLPVTVLRDEDGVPVVPLSRKERGKTGETKVGAEERFRVALELTEEFSDAWVAAHIRDEWVEGNRPVAYSDALGWLYWTGKRWKPVSGNRVQGKVLDYCVAWHEREIRAGVTAERRSRLGQLLGTPRQARVVKALQGLCVVEDDVFDRDPHLLNCPNGIVDLRDCSVRPHDPDLWLTKMTAVRYLPGKRHPVWEKAKSVLPKPKREYLVARLGQAATGYQPPDDKVLFLTGTGGNGKTTFITPAVKALGSYAGAVPQSLLLKQQAGGASPEMMTLRGIRLALVEETPEEARINIQRLKQIAGTAQITARALYKDFVTFEPSHSLVVNTNYPPSVNETDHGTWRRLERVVFGHGFRGGEIDGSIRQRCETDPEVWEAALADIGESAAEWYRHNRVLPDPPDSVVRDTAAWRQANDDLPSFIAENLEASPGSFIGIAEFCEEYNRDSGRINPISEKTLIARLETHEGLPTPFELGGQKHLSRKGGSTRRVNKGKTRQSWLGVKWKDERVRDDAQE